MSLLDRDDVPDAKSRASTSAVDRPRVAASRAEPAPVDPAPMTRTSKPSLAKRSSAASRCSGLSAPLTFRRLLVVCDHPAASPLERAAPVREQRLALVVR